MLDGTDYRRSGGDMSVTPKATPSGFSHWLQGNVAVALTIIGALLYAMFWIPAIFFYAHLGTSPGEVGFTYSTVLTGSVLGTIAILGTLLIAVYYIVFVSLSVLLYLLWLLALIWILFHPSLRKKDENLDADQFERKLRIAKRIYPRRDVPWSDVERLLRRRRELGRLENRTSAEAVELKRN
jgi:hypothetical protein